jgi:hypothetical protein
MVVKLTSSSSVGDEGRDFCRCDATFVDFLIGQAHVKFFASDIGFANCCKPRWHG